MPEENKTFCNPAGKNLLSPSMEKPFVPVHVGLRFTPSRLHSFPAHMSQPSRVPFMVNAVSMGGGDGGQRTLVIFLFLFHLLFFIFYSLYLDNRP